MSGIAGIASPGTEADPALLLRMISALAHRGPDGEGQWASGPIALGHRQLAIEPGAPEDKQPAADTLGERRLVWDGRLDNRGELMAALAADLDRPDVSDADLALAGYRRWGEDVVARLVGDFAFALWDGVTRTLLCARDALGVKPLYYHHDGGRLLFASEIGALFEDRSVPRRPDDATVVDFLCMRPGEAGATLFAGIRRLPPAHLLRLCGDRLTLRRYWTPDPSRTVRYARDEDYHEAFRTLFAEAVRCRLPASAPAAILLSGGIDSTLVAAAAAAGRDPAKAPPLTAITLVYDGFLREEWHVVERLTTATRMRRHVVTGAPGALLLDMLLASREPPDQAGFPLLGALEPAPMAGARVVLTGIGGDELSCGAESGFVGDHLRGLRLVAAVGQAAALAHAYGARGPRAVAAVLWPQLPSAARTAIKALRGRRRPGWLARPSWPRRARAESPRDDGLRFPTWCATQTWRALTSTALGFALDTQDATAAAVGMEARHPYLDRRLVELFLAIPPEVKLRHGYRKQFVQRALAGVAGPPRAREDPALHGPPPDAEAIARQAARISRALFHPSARVFRYVDRAAAQRMSRAHEAGDTRPGRRLADCAVLEAWLQRAFPEWPAGGAPPRPA
jgi:asparagine synthase (glutamine-hydrolysing)